MSDQVLVVDTPSFLNDGIDLKTALAHLTKQQKVAVDTLVKLLKDDDPKIKLGAATKLMEFSIEVAKIINTDSLQRMIAEIKIGRGKRLVDQPPARPMVDFGTIQQVG